MGGADVLVRRREKTQRKKKEEKDEIPICCLYTVRLMYRSGRGAPFINKLKSLVLAHRHAPQTGASAIIYSRSDLGTERCWVRVFVSLLGVVWKHSVAAAVVLCFFGVAFFWGGGLAGGVCGYRITN